MGLFDSKKRKKEEELMKLRRTKCDELLKVGFFGITNVPLDISIVAEYRENVEADIMEYLLLLEEGCGGNKVIYSAPHNSLGFHMMVSQAIASVMYHVYKLKEYDTKKNTIDALHNIIFSELSKKDSRFNNKECDFFAYKDWIIERLINKLDKNKN